MPRDHTRQTASEGSTKRKRFVGDDGPESSKRPALADRDIARLRVMTPLAPFRDFPLTVSQTRRPTPPHDVDAMEIDSSLLPPIAAPFSSAFARPRKSFDVVAWDGEEEL
jgi:hypothetical protein